MNKSHLIISALILTLSPTLLFANPPSPMGYIDATIGVKNNTNNSIEISCEVGTTKQGNYTLGGPQTISKGGAYTFTGLSGDSCSTGNNQIICNYTDTTSGNTGRFTLGACQNQSQWTIGHPITYSNSINVDADGNPPTPYYCTASTASYGDFNEGKQCASNNWSTSGYTCVVEAYFAVGADGTDSGVYHFTWDDIDLATAKGQIIADKLAHELAQNGNYGKVTGVYNKAAKQIAITLPPPDNVSANPYDGMTGIGQCRSACVPS